MMESYPAGVADWGQARACRTGEPVELTVIIAGLLLTAGGLVVLGGLVLPSGWPTTGTCSGRPPCGVPELCLWS